MGAFNDGGLTSLGVLDLPSKLELLTVMASLFLAAGATGALLVALLGAPALKKAAMLFCPFGSLDFFIAGNQLRRAKIHTRANPRWSRDSKHRKCQLACPYAHGPTVRTDVHEPNVRSSWLL